MHLNSLIELNILIHTAQLRFTFYTSRPKQLFLHQHNPERLDLCLVSKILTVNFTKHPGIW